MLLTASVRDAIFSGVILTQSSTDDVSAAFSALPSIQRGKKKYTCQLAGSYDSFQASDKRIFFLPVASEAGAFPLPVASSASFFLDKDDFFGFLDEEPEVK